MKILENILDISIDKHGLIEASAGTGKTYTIENLAIRMIKEKKITLDNLSLKEAIRTTTKNNTSIIPAMNATSRNKILKSVAKVLSLYCSNK